MDTNREIVSNGAKISIDEKCKGRGYALKRLSNGGQVTFTMRDIT